MIDALVTKTRDWRGKTLEHLRRVIKGADPLVIEAVKWRRPSNPDGVPVWSHDGILCVGNLLKNAVRLTFPRGARLKDTKHLFNARLESRTARALDVHEHEVPDKAALRAIVTAAVALNSSEARDR